MKAVYSILLMVLVVNLSLRKAITTVHFLAYQDRIEDLFCINKKDVKMECHGKCFLNKKLTKKDRNEGPVNLPIAKDNLPVHFFAYSITKLPNSKEEKTTAQKFVYRDDFYAHLYLNSVFHPPC